MIIYNYNSLTGEYIGTNEAHESPREPGVFFMPANAVGVAPMTVAENEVAVWDGTKWIKQADYRDKVYYNKTTKEKHEIKEIGIVPDVNWTDVAPTDPDAEWDGSGWAVPFSVLVERKKAVIAQARYNAEIAGINGIHTDRESQSLITGAALKAMQDPNYTCNWKGIDGFVTLNASQIIAIADAVRAHVQSCFDHEADLIPLIEAATTQAELDAINW